MKSLTSDRRISKKDALKEALKRHFRLTKPGQILTPAEGSYFLAAFAGMTTPKLGACA